MTGGETMLEGIYLGSMCVFLSSFIIGWLNHGQSMGSIHLIGMVLGGIGLVLSISAIMILFGRN